MEDSKKIHKFLGKPGEDFHLSCARTEAALEAKEVLQVVTNDVMTDIEELDEATVKAIAIARAIVIQGLGDRPLRLCLSEKDNPHIMWTRLRDRYAVSNTATRVQLQAKLSRMVYQGQSMADYIDAYEEIFNRLAAMNSAVSEDLQIAMLLAFFGDKNQSPYGYVVASLQSVQETLGWETVTARLLQEYDEFVSRSGSASNSRGVTQSQALAAYGYSAKWKKSYKNGKRGKVEMRRCFRCRKIGRIAKDCTRTKKVSSDHSPEARVELHEEKYGVAQHARLLCAKMECDTECQIETEQIIGSTDELNQKPVEIDVRPNASLDSITSNVTLAAWSQSERSSVIDFILDSGASNHMVKCKDYMVDLESIFPNAIILRNGTKVLATHKGTLQLQTLADESAVHLGILVLSNVLYVPQLESNLISCATLCQNCYTFSFDSVRCVGLLDGETQFQGKRVNGIFQKKCVPIRLNEANAHVAHSYDHHVRQKQKMSLWHARLGHAHPERIKKLVRTNAVTGLSLCQEKGSDNLCAGCMKGKQTVAVLKSNRSRCKTKCTAIHSDVCDPMSVSSFSGARFFVCFVDDFQDTSQLSRLRARVM